MHIADNKPLQWGIGMVAVGGLIALSTYTSANSSESYVVTTSLFVVGGLSLFWGIYNQMKDGSEA
ncbi:MAG: hypothetical protein WDZ96_03815 [Acidimicrobiia bacterium]